MTVSIAQAQIFFMALSRVLAIVVHIPVLAGPSVPSQVKIGLGVLLPMVILPWQPLPAGAEGWPAFAFAGAVAREVLIGTIAGFVVQLTFSVLGMAGEQIGQASGFSAGQILNPALGMSGSALDQLFILMATLIFFVINGHHIFLLGLQRTFSVVPLNSPLPALGAENVLQLTAQMIASAVHMALPVVAALLLTDLCLGLLARVAPQMQVYFLGIPLKVGIGLLALSLTLTVMAPHLNDLFSSIGENLVWILGS